MADAAVVREITIRGKPEGIQQTTAQLQDLGSAQRNVIQITDQLRKSIDQATLALNGNVQNLNQLKSANDNVTSSYTDMINGARDVSGGLAATVENTLNLINHFKLLALAAYAMSPAFRAVTNAGIGQALGAIPPIAATAASAFARFATPMLSFFSSIAVPIGVAVVAFESFMGLVRQGSALIDQYTNAQRKMFEGATDAQLDKLTKFQNFDDPAIVQRATELAAKLAEAKQNIADFLKITIDTRDVSLGLQGIWIGIVSAVGNAAKALGNVSGPDLSGNAGATPGMMDVPGIGLVPIGGAGATGAIKGDRIGGTTFDALRMARANLAAGLGGGFAGRFAGDVSALANPPTNTPAAAAGPDALDRFNDALKTQIAELQLQADGANKSSAAVEELKIAHQGYVAAAKAGKDITPEMTAQWKAQADQIAALNIQIRQTQALQSETFKSQTMFMSPGDAAAAGVAHQIDPTNWQAHMQDLAAQTARYNTEIGTARDMTVSFGESVANAMLNGGNRIRSVLIPALQSLEKTLLDMMIKTGVNSLYSLFGSSGSLAPTTSNNPTQIGSLYASGGVFDRGNVIPFAGGGVVTSPMLFPMAGGAGLMGEAGPEAVMPLRRGSDGRLGVSGGGTNVNVIVNNNHSGAGVDVQQRKRPDGDIDIVATVKNIVNDHVASGGIDGPMRARYGQQIRARPR